MRMIGKGAVAVLPAAQTRFRNRDVEFGFRQDSDFYYLTGFNEPEAVAVLIPGRSDGEFLLFCRERDPQQEIWHGKLAGTRDAVAEIGADDAFPIADIDDILPGLIEQCERVYYSIGTHPEFDQRLIGWVTSLRGKGSASDHTPDEFVALDHMLHDLRLYKSRAEISAMRKAARIASIAHKRAMSICRPGLYEYEFEAEFHHEFRRHNTLMAYLPIVGSGPNSCTLHYIDNNRQMQEGDLVLIDIGCEYENYASDVTRTIPVNGQFSTEQRELYNLVLEAQEAALAMIMPGRHWNEPHMAAVKVITRGLRDLGLLKGRLTTLIKDGAYRRFFMHRTGHWLGLDVHDVGDYRVQDQWRQLEPGMALTVEPGLYVAPDDDSVDEQWRGIGIRIEDDVVVTKDGCDVLSHEVPKEVADIEKLMKKAVAS